ncbi:hypothetical protein LXL04_020263 [Taraxacum kok-saghyz]
MYNVFVAQFVLISWIGCGLLSVEDGKHKEIEWIHRQFTEDEESSIIRCLYSRTHLINRLDTALVIGLWVHIDCTIAEAGVQNQSSIFIIITTVTPPGKRKELGEKSSSAYSWNKKNVISTGNKVNSHLYINYELPVKQIFNFILDDLINTEDMLVEIHIGATKDNSFCMEHLHCPKILHLDIKNANILFQFKLYTQNSHRRWTCLQLSVKTDAGEYLDILMSPDYKVHPGLFSIIKNLVFHPLKVFKKQLLTTSFKFQGYQPMKTILFSVAHTFQTQVIEMFCLGFRKIACSLEAHLMIRVHIENTMLRGSDEEMLNRFNPGRQRVVNVFRPIGIKKLPMS